MIHTNTHTHAYTNIQHLTAAILYPLRNKLRKGIISKITNRFFPKPDLLGFAGLICVSFSFTSEYRKNTMSPQSIFSAPV